MVNVTRETIKEKVVSMEMKVIEWIDSTREIVSIIVEHELGKILFAYIGVLLLMTIDILTGFSQAKINNIIASHRMSDGLLKKFNILMLLLVLMFICILLPKNIGYTTLAFVFIYEYINELTSIGENLLKMNIKSNFMQPILKVLDKYLNNYEKGDRDGNSKTGDY